MSSTTVSVPKYRHHKGSGQAFVQVQGCRHYLGKWNTQASKERYAAFVAELAIRPDITPQLPLATPASAITVVELCAVYWDFAQRYYTKNGKPSGWLDHIRLMLRKLRSTYGLTPAADFGPLKLKAIRQTLIDAGHSRVYINKLVPIIPRMFKWAAAEEIIPGTTYHALRTVEGLRKGRTEAHETKPVLPVADEVVNATLPYLPVIVAAMVRFQRLTGCRPGELCQLRPCDVDRSGDVWQYRPESHKTEHHGRERIIYIGPQAQDVLRPYLLRDAQAHCFSPAESESKRHDEQRATRRTRVQPSQRNRRKARPGRAPRTTYTKDSYQRAIKRAILKANRQRTEEAADMGVEPMLLPHWHANQLRHSKATEVRRQFGLEAAQVSLGHAKADVTQIYAERDSALAVEVARKIG
jgi:integrase